MAGVCTGPGPCDTSPLGPGPNWVTKAGKGTATGGLPAYIRAIAQAQVRAGRSEQEAIRLAVGVVRDWAQGKGHVTEATRVRARRALAQWEALKAKSHERSVPMGAVETRALPGTEIRSFDQDSHEFTARVLTYGQADSYGTVWQRGVFTASLERRMPTVCWQHDLSRPIGRAVDFTESAEGLEVRARLADIDAVPDARMAFALMRDGVTDGFSVGFRRSEWDTVPADQRSAFGSHEAKEFMRSAHLEEFSAVTVASVPGTALLALRSDDVVPEEGLMVPDVDMILRLRDANLLDEREARAMLGTILPDGLREHITVRADSPATGSDDDGDAADLAGAVDAALDEAARLLDGVDTSSLPDTVQQALALVQAAGVAVDDLLEVMGVADPDDGDHRADTDFEERAKYTAAQLRQLLKEGKAIANADGEPSFPIDDTEDLHHAIRAVGRGGADHDRIRAYIIKRAKQMGQSDAIPDDWASDGSVKSRSDGEPEPRSVADFDIDTIFARHGIG